jgi:phosphate transport system substrate-binding protein
MHTCNKDNGNAPFIRKLANLGRASMLRLAHILPLATTCVALSLGVAAAHADDRHVELQVDRANTIIAESVKVDGGYVQIVLPLAGSHTLRMPIERVACIANCPIELAQLTQATAAGTLPKNAKGFQVHGSNTIGAELMPELIRDFLDLKQANPKPGPFQNERREIEFQSETGARGTIEVFSKGSSTGFEMLKDKKAAIWMSSRPVTSKELAEAREKKLGNLQGADSEHIFALDGLSIIVNPNNPVSALSLEQVAGIFAGEITDWSEVKGPSGAIKVFRRDDSSGTTATFKDLVLQKKSFAASAIEKETADLENEVQRDEAAIGFVGHGFVRNTKALAIKTSCEMAFRPDTFTIKTEEYPLSRRLFFYTLGRPENDVADELIKHILSDRGQQLVHKSGFVDLGVGEALPFERQGERLANMLAVGERDLQSTKKFVDIARFAKRLSLTFRFRPDSSDLDNKAMRDLQVLANALKTEQIPTREFLLLGFTDDKDGSKALQVSELRAKSVAKALQQALNDHPNKAKEVKVYSDNVLWFGSAAPVACNDERGRPLNRRVEVWVR